MLKRSLSVILIIAVVICPVFSAYALSDDEKYNITVDALKELISTYSSQDDTIVGTLDDLRMNFFALGNYHFSQQFVDYIDVLRHIENKDYDKIFLLISIMENSASFVNFLTDEKESQKDSMKTFGSLAELEAYAKARKAQDENNDGEAFDYYIKCTDFLDSYERIGMLSQNQNEADYQKAIQLMKNDTLEDYIMARKLLKELVKTNYRESKGYLSTVEYRIQLLSAPTATPTPTSTPTPTTKPVKSISAYNGSYIVSESAYVVNNNPKVDGSKVADNDYSTAWNVRSDRYGVGEWVSIAVRNAENYRFDGFNIYNGYNKINNGKDHWQLNTRVKTLDVYCDNHYVETFTLLDTRSCQTFYFKTPQTGTSLRFEIASVYIGDKHKDACITEIILF